MQARQLHDSESAHQNLNALNAQQERELTLRVRELDESRKELQDSKNVHDEQIAQCASVRVSLEKGGRALKDHNRHTQNAEVEVALKTGQIQQLQNQVCKSITLAARSSHPCPRPFKRLADADDCTVLTWTCMNLLRRCRLCRGSWIIAAMHVAKTERWGNVVYTKTLFH